MSFLALPLRGYSAALTAQGLGAALSPVVGGWIAQSYCYPACFMTLGVLPVVSIVAWVVDKRELDAACGPAQAIPNTSL